MRIMLAIATLTLLAACGGGQALHDAAAKDREAIRDDVAALSEQMALLEADNDALRKEIRDRDPLYLPTPGFSETRTDGEVWYSEPVGGNGGRSFSLDCPAGQVGTVISGRSGSVLDRISLICQVPLGVDAENHGSPSNVGKAGGSGGVQFVLGCNPGEVIVGVTGRAAALIDSLAAVCSPIENHADALRFTPDGLEVLSNTTGGKGGDEFHLHCPGEMALSGISGRAEQMVDSLLIRCSYL